MSARDLESGVQLANRYTLVRKLGAGGGTVTWLANDRMTRASVALKAVVDDSYHAELLHREWQLSIRLVHAHIVRVFEYHGDGEIPFYTMQYVDGPDIGVLSGAPLADLLPAIAQVADALRYAHTKGVVHRDIKATNVLVDGNGAPYLADFGIAARGDDQVGGGSPISATPQSLAGEAPAPADDIFALGSLIYELVSGRPPWSPGSLDADICKAAPGPLTAAAGEPVPDEIGSLVARMLDKDAAARPDAAAVLDALAAAGFGPAPVPARYVESVRAIGDELIDAGAARHRSAVEREKRAAVAEPGEQGFGPRAIAASLAVLLLILFGVVFLLPDRVEEIGEAVPLTEDTTETGAAERASDDEAVAGNVDPQRDERVIDRQATEAVLGELLAHMRTLEGRAVQRWGGLRFEQAQAAYAAGDEAFLANRYEQARTNYERAIDLVTPLLDQVDDVFAETMSAAEAAFAARDSAEAVRLYDLAVAITPSHGPARAGLTRARNLDDVVQLTNQALQLERNLELAAARQAFERVLELDPKWQAARDGVDRVDAAVEQMDFDARMSEGFAALAAGDFLSARAAFRVAQNLRPSSPEPGDGLLQVEQGLRLAEIRRLEQRAGGQEGAEEWQAAADTYREILELDASLAFAQEGLRRSTTMAGMHETIDDYIDNPDSLSSPRAMQSATELVVEITRMQDIGPRLADRRDELSRLLKRASTPLTVQLVSDNATDVSVYKVGRLGQFTTTQLSLRPGTYVAVGSRTGYRDVRVEFRVAPEEDSGPVIVRCEERI